MRAASIRNAERIKGTVVRKLLLENDIRHGQLVYMAIVMATDEVKVSVGHFGTQVKTGRFSNNFLKTFSPRRPVARQTSIPSAHRSMNSTQFSVSLRNIQICDEKLVDVRLD